MAQAKDFKFCTLVCHACEVLAFGLLNGFSFIWGLSDVWGDLCPPSHGGLVSNQAQAWCRQAKLPSFYTASAYARFTPPMIWNCRVSPHWQCDLRNVHIAVGLSHLNPSELNWTELNWSGQGLNSNCKDTFFTTSNSVQLSVQVRWDKGRV